MARASRKVVALTFDDGPSEYTPGFLQVLREKGVHGTFFEIGQEMAGREATMRQILAEGNEIGDHTMNHVEYPGYAQIAGAAHADRAIHPLQALPLPAAGRGGRRQRDRHRRQPRDADDHLGRRPARLVDPRHRRDLQHDRRQRPARLDHPHARRRRPARRDPGGAAGDHRHPARPRLRLRDGQRTARLPASSTGPTADPGRRSHLRPDRDQKCERVEGEGRRSGAQCNRSGLALVLVSR